MATLDVYSAALRFSINGEKTVNVLHFQQVGVDPAGPPNVDLCNAIVQDIWPSYKACLSADATLQNISCRKIHPALGGSVVVDVNEVGGVAADTNPPNACVVATLYSDTLTRRGRGRIFISGIPDTHTDHGRLVVTPTALYVTFLDTLMVAAQTATGPEWHCCVWSASDVGSHDYTSYMIRARLTVLRSRRMANP